MEKELKPIGTEFWYEFPYDPCSGMSCSKQSRFLYRVTSHDEAIRFQGDKIGELIECVKAIKSENRNLIGITKCKECDGVKYEFGEWKED